MSDTHTSGTPAEAPVVADTKIEAPEAQPMNARDAARYLRSLRDKPKEQEAPALSEMKEAVATPEESTAQAEDAAPPQEPSGETQEAEPAEPIIEPPRSWTKEAREQWQTLPRNTQEYIAQREQERDREVRRSQNEAAEQRKAFEAERSQVEQARQQYEQALPQLLMTLQSQQAGAFGDIKSIADVERLATEDWPRYLQWDLQQKKIAAVQQEYQSAQQRQQQEQQRQFAEYGREQDKLIAEKIPELADPEKGPKLREQANRFLTDELGFAQDDLRKAWNTKSEFSLRDHRVQQIIVDAVKWRDAQTKAKAVAAKPLPPVQRPGVSQGKGAQQATNVQNLTNKLPTVRGTNALRVATELMRARRGGRRIVS